MNCLKLHEIELSKEQTKKTRPPSKKVSTSPRSSWFYEMINLITIITGNVQLTSAENEGRSELDLFFLKIQKSHCLMGSTSSSCGRLTSLIKKYCY